MHLLFFFVTGEAARSLFNSDRDPEECPAQGGTTGDHQCYSRREQ
jgi:hypothetical protein